MVIFRPWEDYTDVEMTQQASALNVDSLILSLPGDRTAQIELSTSKPSEKPLSRVLIIEDR